MLCEEEVPHGAEGLGGLARPLVEVSEPLSKGSAAGPTGNVASFTLPTSSMRVGSQDGEAGVQRRADRAKLGAWV